MLLLLLLLLLDWTPSSASNSIMPIVCQFEISAAAGFAVYAVASIFFS